MPYTKDRVELQSDGKGRTEPAVILQVEVSSNKLQEMANSILGSSCTIHINGLFCVVEGLPSIETWEGKMLSKWRSFEKTARRITP